MSETTGFLKHEEPKEIPIGSGAGGNVTRSTIEVNGTPIEVAIKRPLTQVPYSFNLGRFRDNFRNYFEDAPAEKKDIVEAELKHDQIPNLGDSEIGRIIRYGYSDPSKKMFADISNPPILQFISEADTLPYLTEKPETARFVPRIYDAKVDLGNFGNSYIVMEYLPEGLDRVSKNLTLTERISFATDMIEAVKAFHEAGVSLTDFGPNKFDRFRLRTTTDENGNQKKEIVVIDFSGSGDSIHRGAVEEDINNLKLHLFNLFTGDYASSMDPWGKLRKKVEEDGREEDIRLLELIKDTNIVTLQNLFTEMRTIGKDYTKEEFVQTLETKKRELILNRQEELNKLRDTLPFIPIDQQLGKLPDVPMLDLMRRFSSLVAPSEYFPNSNSLTEARREIIMGIDSFEMNIIPKIRSDLEQGGYDFQTKLIVMNLSTLTDVKRVLHNIEVIEALHERNLIDANLEFIPKLKNLASLIGSVHEARDLVYQNKPTEISVTQILENLNKVKEQFPKSIFFTDIDDLIAGLDQQPEV